MSFKALDAKKPKLILITGTCGVGKSSVSSALAQKLEGTHIECDLIRDWIKAPGVRSACNFQEIALVHICLEAAEQFRKQGLDTVCDNVWGPEGIDLFKKHSGMFDLSVFYLTCESGENHKRDEERSASDQMKGRVDELGQELDRMQWPWYTVKLDTTGLSVEETVEEIVEKINSK